MTIQSSERFQKIVEALELLKKLEIPDHLQSTALEYLLLGDSKGFNADSNVTFDSTAKLITPSAAVSLRSFVGDCNPKNAVSQIPCLLYWAREYEGEKEVNEKKVIELYRRAGLRPPKNVIQSLRDLCSKKYGRLESVENGNVKLSRVGEDFVLHDLLLGS